jgi:hypothetical protein
MVLISSPIFTRVAKKSPWTLDFARVGSNVFSTLGQISLRVLRRVGIESIWIIRGISQLCV